MTVVGLAFIGCGPIHLDIGDSIQQAWVVNQSAAPVIIQVEGQESALVRPGHQGEVYSASGHDVVRLVRVLSEDCAVLGEAENREWLLLIKVSESNSVTFEQGANLSPLVGGVLPVTDRCV